MSNNEYMQPGFPGGPMGGQPQVLAPKGKGKRKRAERGPRRSASSFRWLFLFFAAAAGILGVIITTSPSSTVWVVRSQSPIAPLTGIDRAMFTFAEVEPTALEPDTFSGADQEEVRDAFLEAIEGKWFLYPVPAGQQIRSTSLVPSGDLATPLAADERLVSITARAADAVAGTIRSGSIVDIYVSNAEGLTGALGQGVEIVSVSLAPEQFDSVAQQQFQDPEKSLSDFVSQQPVGGTYVIRVKASDVARYIAADTAGKITLSLRGNDSRVFTAVPTDILSTICGTASVEPACARAGQ